MGTSGQDLIVLLHLNSDISATLYRLQKLKAPLESKFHAACSSYRCFFLSVKLKLVRRKKWCGHQKIVFRGPFSFPVQPDVVVYR